jgi:AAA+ superfamily predicted ATPase
VILFVDEADALAQSREASQMHHEDRAGVNVLIRGVDRIGRSRLPAAVIMCTNRLLALDPAISRRAADILVFSRPDDDQRRRVLSSMLSGLRFSGAEVEALVEITGPRDGRTYGFTFSDLVQRLLPAIALDAYPTQSVNPSRAVELARSLEPTPPFKESL